MEKRHYEKIAAVIAGNLNIPPTPDFLSSEYDAGWTDACEQIARQLAFALRDDNPRFNEEKFLAACGLGAVEQI